MKIKNIISLAVAFINAFVFGIAPLNYEPQYVEVTKLNFAVISDIHLESNNVERLLRFPLVLKGIRSCSDENELLVTLGDNTMNGQKIEYEFLEKYLKSFGKFKNTMIVMGNHEYHDKGVSSEEAVLRFEKYASRISGESVEKPYYFKVINGCYFIALASEKNAGDSAYISDEQLAWLDRTLDAATSNGLPAFVFCHFPINDVMENYWPNGQMGEQSEAVYQILKDHKNVFWFSGHLHNPAALNGAFERDGVVFVDLPSLLSDDIIGGSDSVGVGYEVEVYETKVCLRARNFLTGEWVEGLCLEKTLEAVN